MALAGFSSGKRETDEALTFCPHRTGAVYFCREEMVMATAKKRALLCSGFREWDVWGYREQAAATKSLLSTELLVTFFSWFPSLPPLFFSESKGKLPLNLKYKCILTSASCSNPKSFVKEILSEGLHLQQESIALFLWGMCSSPAWEAASWLISGHFLRNTSICKVIQTDLAAVCCAELKCSSPAPQALSVSAGRVVERRESRQPHHDLAKSVSSRGKEPTSRPSLFCKPVFCSGAQRVAPVTSSIFNSPVAVLPLPPHLW